MRRLEIYRELHKHVKLGERRAANFKQVKYSKLGMTALVVAIELYLMFFSILMALAVNDFDDVTAMEFIFGLGPFWLITDFFFNIMIKKTPVQMVKPYVLLPIPRSSCIDSFIISELLSTGNLLWLGLFIPYSLMAVLFSDGVFITIEYMVIWGLLFLANGQWYSICRTKANDHVLWWTLAVAPWLFAAIPSLFCSTFDKGVDEYFEHFAYIGTMIDDGSLIPLLGTIALLILVTLINRHLQYTHVYKELSKIEETKLKIVSKFSFFDRFGEIGQYMKLEIKGIMRNKSPRKKFIMANFVVVLLSLIISFTSTYNDSFSTYFWCIYNYFVYCGVILGNIMCFEGNYIDGLMVHKENLLSLLKAKYLFYSALLLLPFILMLPTVIMGKWSLWLLVSMLVFTAGFQYFIIFQLAVYNKTTLPLNASLTEQKSNSNNYLVLLFSLIPLTVPVGAMMVMSLFMSDTSISTIMFFIGTVFILTSNLWMRNIYNRMMRRRYGNLESFRASR